MKIRALCPISGSNDSCKRHEMRLISKLGTVHPLGINERFSYIHLMLTYLCLTHSLLLALRFCFLPHFVCASLLGIIFCNMIYISLFTLCFDEIHLIGFYFVTWCFCINSYKNTRGFPRPPLLTPDEGPSLKTSIFAFILFQVVREPLPVVYTRLENLYSFAATQQLNA